MRRLTFLIAGAGLALMVAAPAVVGDSDKEFRASLNGYLEVPSISTTARGSFFAEVKGDTIRYRLSFRDLGSIRCSPTSTSLGRTSSAVSPPSCAAAVISRHARCVAAR